MNKTQDDEQDADEITETELEQITRKHSSSDRDFSTSDLLMWLFL